VLTQVDLRALINFHRGRHARATIVLTPVDNPTAYGLVETDAASNIRRFLEKPKLEEITCNTINAGIYVLEPETFDRIPPDVAWSIERSFFPSFIERGETFLASIYRDYWIDIGTPEKYMQVHRDIMDGRYSMPPFNGEPGIAWVSPAARVDPSAQLEGPLFVDEGCVVQAGARLGPYTVLGKNSHVEEGANVAGAIIWADSRIEREATVTNTIIGRSGQIGRHAQLNGGVLGDRTSIADYSRL
jgi:mannose-1-phosphate guanylyltransferase